MRKAAYASLFCLLLMFGLSEFRAVFGYNEVVAPYGPAPTIDGTVGSGEWGGAALSFAYTQIFTKQDGNNLYVAFIDTDDSNPHIPLTGEDYSMILFDVDNDRKFSLQPDDLWLMVERNGTLLEARVTTGQWTNMPTVSGWEARAVSSSQMWQCEFNISYSKIGVTAGVAKTIGVVFANTHGPRNVSEHVYSWPSYDEMSWTQIRDDPAAWGTLDSSGFDWIPELPSFLALSLFIISTLLSIPAFRKARATYRKART